VVRLLSLAFLAVVRGSIRSRPRWELAGRTVLRGGRRREAPSPRSGAPRVKGTSLESTILQALLAGEAEELATLRRQLAGATRWRNSLPLGWREERCIE